MAFVLKWPSGSASGFDGFCRNLEPIIRAFVHELRHVPETERELATATIRVGLRKARGGVVWTPLASWSGKESVQAFLQRARSAWRSHPKEDDERRIESVCHEL